MGIQTVAVRFRFSSCINYQTSSVVKKMECCEREGCGAWYLFEMLQSQIS